MLASIIKNILLKSFTGINSIVITSPFIKEVYKVITS